MKGDSVIPPALLTPDDDDRLKHLSRLNSRLASLLSTGFARAAYLQHKAYLAWLLDILRLNTSVSGTGREETVQAIIGRTDAYKDGRATPVLPVFAMQTPQEPDKKGRLQ